MIISFDILTQFSIRHDYYDGGLVPSLQIVPSAETQGIISNYRMIAKVNKGVYEVGIEVESVDGKKRLVDRLQSPFELIFLIQTNDSLWSNFTEQIPRRNHVYFFSNFATSKGDSVTYLHEESRVGENNQIAVQSERFMELSSEGDATLTRHGAEDLDCSYAVIVQNEQRLLDTKTLDEGRYTLTVGDSTQTFFHLKNASTMDGIIHIVVDPANETTDPIVDSQWSLTHSKYSIHFKNRSTYWRYNFPKNQIEHMEGLQVTNGSETEIFSAPEEITAPNGQSMYCFTSLEPLELKNKPNHLLQLKKNVDVENRSEGVVIDRLPGPNKENLYRVGEHGDLISDVFINL